MKSVKLKRERIVYVFGFVIAFIIGLFILTEPAYAATTEIIEEQIVYMDTPEYICVVADNPTADKYRYYTDSKGKLCIKNSDGHVFAKECEENQENAIYVYTPEKGSNELVPMLRSNGTPMAVTLT